MSIRRIFLLALVCLLAGLLALQSQRVPSVLQYAFLPAELNGGESDRGLLPQDEGEGEEDGEARPENGTPFDLFVKSWEEFVKEEAASIKAALITAHRPETALSTPEGGSAGAELTALYGDLHALPADVLISGRQIYQEEIEDGKAVAVLDEALAIALFRQGDPVGMTFTMFDIDFTVVGVVRHSRALGERAASGLRVPMKAFSEQPDWELLTAQLVPGGGSGTRNGLGASLRGFRPGGQVNDLVKEKYRTLLPIRFLLCFLGFALALAGLKLAGRGTSALVADLRRRLESSYAARLLPRFLLAGVLIALMYALGVLVMIYAFTQLLAPVYVFPEWVPAILVEPREIIKTFWDNRSQVSGLVSLRSKELLTLQACRAMLTALTALAGAMLITPLGKLINWASKPKGQ